MYECGLRFWSRHPPPPTVGFPELSDHGRVVVKSFIVYKSNLSSFYHTLLFFLSLPYSVFDPHDDADYPDNREHSIIYRGEQKKYKSVSHLTYL